MPSGITRRIPGVQTGLAERKGPVLGVASSHRLTVDMPLPLSGLLLPLHCEALLTAETDLSVYVKAPERGMRNWGQRA